MNIYKIRNNVNANKAIAIIKNDYLGIPFDPANIDYQQFKVDLANNAELQDADGNVMTAEQVANFVSTLP